ncbi:MAG: class I SAM-dependent methyltransferase [bacterium]
MNLIERGYCSAYLAGQRLRGDERVLVLGPTPAALAECASDRLKSGTVTCVDSTGGLAGLASPGLGRRQNVNLPAGNICSMELPDGEFDIVFADRAISRMGLAERQSVMQRIARLLKPAGELREREPAGPRGMATDELANLAGLAGLRVLKLEYVNTFRFGRMVDAVFVRSSY